MQGVQNSSTEGQCVIWRCERNGALDEFTYTRHRLHCEGRPRSHRRRRKETTGGIVVNVGNLISIVEEDPCPQECRMQVRRNEVSPSFYLLSKHCPKKSYLFSQAVIDVEDGMGEGNTGVQEHELKVVVEMGREGGRE